MIARPTNGLERFHAVIENSPDAVSFVNAEGQVLYASASTAKVLGYQPEELLGQNSVDLIHPEDRDYAVRSLKEVIVEPQSPNRMQVRVLQKDGQWVWVESTACNLLDEPRVCAIVVSFREISRRKAAELEWQHRVKELARSNVELQAFAHTVAHDLREPLRTISALTELLFRDGRLGEAAKETADLVVGGVRRMSALLDELLSSATYGFDDSRCPVELELAAAQAMQNLRAAITSSGATITIDALPTVQGNESDFVRLFQNLISNAVKYRSEAAVEVHIAAERSGPDWVIRIRDNGIGIAKKHHRSVFGLFTRPHTAAIPGTGIGLAICKKIVEGLGGTIWVESEPGAGSTFCFTVAAEQETAGSRDLSGG